MLVALAAGALCMSLVWWSRGNIPAMALAMVLVVASGGLWALSKRGGTALATVLITLALNVITIAGVAYFGGPRGHAPAFLMVVVMCTGLLAGWQGGAMSLGVCMAYLAVDGFYGPPAWATGKIATLPSQVTGDWLLALCLSGILAIVAFHTASQRIAEAKQSEADKQEALLHAEAGSRAKSAFLANMSHELRTPLTAILGYAELMGDDVDGESKEDLEKIVHSGQHLLALIDDVLDMARVESGRSELHLAPFDLHALVAEVASMLAPAAQQAHSEVHVRPSPRCLVHADRRRTRQILQNLYSNALKYAPGRVDVVVERHGTEGRLTVRDHGTGIPASVLPKLFTPFSRGHGSDVQGTGLGLALSSSLATQMGGTLTVQTHTQGATFTLSLPAHDEADQPFPPPEPSSG